MALKFCPDYYERVGWDEPPSVPVGTSAHKMSPHCCESCHEDLDRGADDLATAPGEPDSMICCAMYRALRAEEDGKEPS